jgi:acyl-CoA thioester hydrolase
MRVTLVRIDHEYELFHDEALIAKAASTLACVDRNGQVQRIPDWLLIEPADTGHSK